MSFWDEDERDSLDHVVINNTAKSPGVCKVLPGDGIPREWDVRQGFGLAGATQAFRGLGLAEFGLELRLWEAEHRAAWEVFDSAIEPSLPGQPEKSYQINHPVLALRGITACVFLNAPMPQPQEDGSVLVTYKCRQWRKPLPALTSPTSPGQNSAEGRAVDEFEARIEERRQVFERLLGGADA